MDNFDIIIYAAIAAFLFFRLWSVLGQRDDENGKDTDRPNPFESSEERDVDDEDVPVLEGRARPVLPGVLTQSGHAPASLAGALDSIKVGDPTFDEKKFIEGAKQAFRDIVAAYAAGDLAPVLWLLGPNVRKLFEFAIDGRKSRSETLHNSIDRIAAADIVAAKLDGDEASLTVEFVSYQINQTTKSGENESAKPARPEEIRDLWTFRRNIKAADPNWLLIETRT